MMQQSVHKWHASVGENAGMTLYENGGIKVYITTDKPEGVPDENWLPINRKDEDSAGGGNC